MTRRWLAAVAALFMAAATLPAQEVTYSLPFTTLQLEVEVRQESFFAGPYARFAHQMLNMDVREEDEVNTVVTRVEMVPLIEADPEARYTCDGESATLLALSAQGLVSFGTHQETRREDWRFLPQLRADYSASGITKPTKEISTITYRLVEDEDGPHQVPVEHKSVVAKSLEDKASDAADMILVLRRQRLDIATGNTDATYAGEAMAAALQELDRAEQEYLALFRGYSVVRTLTAHFEVRPLPSQRVQRYLAFRLTEDGPVAGGQEGTPFYVVLQPEALAPVAEGEESDRKKGKGPLLHYRIPAVCEVRLTEDGMPLGQARIPIYQLGKESTLPVVK